MKLLATLFFVFSITLLSAQTPKPNPRLDFEYFIQGDDGYNGLTVTYNPTNNYYYCIYAGNADFPMEVFNAGGEMIYSGKAQMDVRGLWYNPKLNCLEGTKYPSGNFKMYLNDKGIPSNPVFQSANEFIPPYEQCQVVCDPSKGILYSYYDGIVYVYQQKTNKLKKKILLKNCPVNFSNINPYAIGFTGYKNYELVLYDVYSNQVLFFNLSGKYIASVKMPYGIPYISSFRFGYTNNRIFLYDEETRSWQAYLIFGGDAGN